MITSAAVVLALVTASLCAEDPVFPTTVKFGAATAAYQVEGGWNVSDKGLNNWDTFTHTHGVSDGSNGDVACDSYHQWKRDIEMVSELGLDFYRFSLSWTRLLPSGFPNHISEDGINYYNNLINGLLDKGIEPLVTIYHWDLPQQLQDLGGWNNPLISDWFADYARVVFHLFGDRVKTWLTINEPISICDGSSALGMLAPAIVSPDNVATYICTKNVLIAHAKAWRLYDEEFRPKYKGQLESLARSLESDKGELQAALRDQRRELAEKEDQLQELLALKLDEDNQNEKSEIIEGKASARTLSDIVSISEFDEQDLQMRRAELRAHNMSLAGAPYATDVREKSQLNRTLPPELQRANMSSLNIEAEHYDGQNTPRADSLPAHLTSTQNRDIIKHYKRNVNETTMFGTIDKFGDSVKHSTAQNIPDNCSLYPNREVNETKDVSVEPKKIDFSIEASNDNRTHEDEEFTSLRELGITLDIRQENFPDILTQLKHEIKKSRAELENCKSELKNAEEQLCEFPALKEEVEELKGLLENTMATMETDKKFYENQLDNFSSNKKLLEQRIAELSQEVNEKSKDLHLLKEDILRRENMILELAKEKRNLTNKLTELEVKIDEVQSRNSSLEKSESENYQLKEKLNELNKLEQLVSEKNQQIDSLNQHLDRFDDLQRCLNDKTEEFENLKEAFEEKSNELFQLQDTVEALTKDLNEAKEENNNLITNNKELKLKLTKLEKEQENTSIKLHNSETELQKLNSLNNELTLKIEELKLLIKLPEIYNQIEIANKTMDFPKLKYIEIILQNTTVTSTNSRYVPD